MAKRKPVPVRRRSRSAAQPIISVPDGAVEFEHFALAVLRADASARKRRLLTGSEAGAEYAFADAVAPAGAFGLDGPTVIEVKRELSEAVLVRFIKRALSAKPDIKSFLLMSKESIPNSAALQRHGRRQFPEIQLRVLGIEDLRAMAQSHPDATLPFQHERVGEAVVQYQKRDHSTIREEHIEAIRAAYNEDKLVLMLGAGVSMSAGFPSWERLIQDLSLKFFVDNTAAALPSQHQTDVYNYFKAGAPPSPLIVARLLKGVFGDRFPHHVRDSLYAYSKGNRSSALVQELAALCMPHRDRRGLAAVVSYNFDDVLETELESKNIRHHTLLNDADEPLRNELPIYHVHGYLPRNGELTAEHINSVVLSEDTYHNQFIDSYLWSNLVQLNFLRSNVCLLVGFSLSDPNQRRLLEITFSKKPNVRHYAILQDHWIESGVQKMSTSLTNFAKTFRGLEESSLEGLGVAVIWVRTFDEIPTLLRRIRG